MSTSKEFTVNLLDIGQHQTTIIHQSTFQQQLHSFDSHQLIRIFQIKQQKLYKTTFKIIIQHQPTTTTIITITNFKIIPQNQPI